MNSPLTAGALTRYLDLFAGVLILGYGGMVAMDGGSGALTPGQLVTFQLYWAMVNSGYKSLNNVINSFTRAAGAAQRVVIIRKNLYKY